MPEEYTAESRKEAQQIKQTLNELNKLLESDRLRTVYASDATALRDKVSELLSSFNTDLSNLAEVDRADIFRTDPTLAQRRYILIKNLEASKTVFEFEILRALEQLTTRVVEQAKQHPPASLDVSSLPPPAPGDHWTVQKVVDAAERFVEQATKAGQVVSKAYTLVKALGLLVGLPVP